MRANARAARRCRLRRPASQPLWSCFLDSHFLLATTKRLRSRFCRKAKQRLVARPKGASALSAVFPPTLTGLHTPTTKPLPAEEPQT